MFIIIIIIISSSFDLTNHPVSQFTTPFFFNDDVYFLLFDKPLTQQKVKYHYELRIQSPHSLRFEFQNTSSIYYTDLHQFYAWKNCNWRTSYIKSKMVTINTFYNLEYDLIGYSCILWFRWLAIWYGFVHLLVVDTPF